VRQVEVNSEAAGTRLDQFLMRLLPGIPRNRIFRIIRKGEVRVNGKRAGPEHRLQEHDTVRVPPVRMEAEPEPGQPKRVPRPVLEAVAASIISEDDKLLVLDKPAGVAVHGGSGVSSGVIEALRTLRPNEELELVHRLDRETSGCLIVARKRSALRTLHELMREGLVEKRYLALLKGHWNLGHTKIDVPLRTDIRVGGERTVKADASGKEAISEFRPIQWFGKRATLVEVSLHTGRTHQIRVHSAHAGNPVAGDEKYGDEEFNAEMKALGLDRMFLHAASVSFDWPQGGVFSASAPLPVELSTAIDALGNSPRDQRSREFGDGGGRSKREPGSARKRAAVVRARHAVPQAPVSQVSEGQGSGGRASSAQSPRGQSSRGRASGSPSSGGRRRRGAPSASQGSGRAPFRGKPSGGKPSRSRRPSRQGSR
jgi:23S rRNA pseudouridine955/2504/2580 synthase